MKLFSIVITALGIVATLLRVPAQAQNFNLQPGLTKAEFKTFADEIGSVLRFRQLGDPAPIGKGEGHIGVQFANTPFDDALPRVVGRFGLSDRVDFGAWGGFNTSSNWGLAGIDTTIALVMQGPGRPVTISLRPSITSLIGPSEVWVGNASIDLSVTRTYRDFSPYAGVATTGSAALERSKDIDLDPVVADGGSLAYAGLSYRWRSVVASAEVEKGSFVSYGFRIGTRF
jgi:hypothetical protein